ncbi:RNA polymerase sigma-70 factor [Sphingobacterium sp. xlx-130]|uniref:RNA polymerase sigma-70 factor n=1 Tax=Sphingobacterium sp. xlx-130 TaxID=2654323 RepID=UPI0013D9BA62|nr:RNA polymerase sigma-70 factor [Sphingobacterium sp. xlx-130]
MKPNDHQERLLLLALNAGSESALDYFFYKFYPLLFLFAKRLMNDEAASDEIVQDVFVKLWQGKHSFQTVASLKAFLYISTKNGCLNYIKKSQNREKYEEYYVKLSEGDEQPVLNQIIRSEVWSNLSCAIDKLPDQCGKIIRMLFEEDLKPKEIAEKLNLNISTVNSQKARGLSLLKKSLSKNDFDLLLIILIANQAVNL